MVLAAEWKRPETARATLAPVLAKSTASQCFYRCSGSTGDDSSSSPGHKDSRGRRISPVSARPTATFAADREASDSTKALTRANHSNAPCVVTWPRSSGLRATQSNLSGAEFAEDNRYQVFLTYGLFRRVDYGMQYGMVMDYLNDDWYYQVDLLQLRGELSWKSRGCNVYGFQFMAPLNSETSGTIVRDSTGNFFASTTAFEATDQYRFFYRRLLGSAGQWDFFGGWTGPGDGLIGSTFNLPVRRNLVLQTGSTFLIPREGNSSGGHREEGWNISVGLVYRPGGPTGAGRYSRPMFDVADNGTFMVDLD